MKATQTAAVKGKAPRKVLLNPTLLPRVTSKSLKRFSEKNLKKLTLVAIVFVFAFTIPRASAQFDAAFGVSTLSAPASTTTGGVLFPSLSGGTYPGFSFDFLIHHRIGVEGEMFWRASQNLYGGYQPYRPIFYAFNGIWAPRLGKNFTAEVVGGIGGEDLRFYGFLNCNSFFGCTTYASSNHFMGDFGGGIRAYVWHNMFVRPEARFYLVHNNVEFSSGHSARYGISLGYTFGER